MFLRRVPWRPALTVLVLCAAPIALAWPWLNPRAPDLTSRVYKIGWTISPPFQVRGENGKPTGLAVDLVREAARRRGIRLEWVFWDRSSESALRTKAVDLWPFITLTPERRKWFHITEPFMETEHCLLVRADSSWRKAPDLATAAIGIANPPIDEIKLHSRLPLAKTVVRATPLQIIEDVCEKRTAAAFMDAYTGISALLDKGTCAGVRLRWIAVPEVKTRLGIGATFEYRGVADALRAEIGAISREGKLTSILGQWGYMSSQQLESMGELIDAKEREARLIAATILFAALFLLAWGQTVRVTRERNRTRQAEFALRQTERKLRLMANNLKEMVMAFDMDRKLIYANPAVETMTGYSIADLERKGLIDWFHPEDRDRMLARRASLFEGAELHDEEYRLVARSGTVKWAAAIWVPILDDGGRQIGVQGSERDITQRKCAELALRESERQFRGLLENVQIAAAMFDGQGNYIFCNQFFLELTGWEREEILGHSLIEFVAPEDKHRLTRFMESWSAARGPATWFDEPIIMTKTGGRRFLQANHVGLRDSEGRVAGFATLAVDVTEYRALQEQYLQSRKMESVGRLAGGIAHDFNNMLTVINGYSDVLMRRLNPGDPLLEAAVEINNAGRQAAAVTRQLLCFSRKQAIELTTVDLNGLIARNRCMLRQLIGETIELFVELDSQPAFVMADSGQMLQILMNLAANARDAMPSGGVLRIVTASENKNVTLTVSDTGGGIDANVLPAIFDPFFTTKGEGEGTGLGLSLVYGIVNQWGGSISVQSVPASGATFRVALPRAEASAATESFGEDDGEGAIIGMRGTETILVVEDRQEVRRLTATLLESWGYRVLEASAGHDAISRAERHAGTIDLLLTDIAMPRMAGQELAGRIRALRPQIKLLYMSGYADAITRLRRPDPPKIGSEEVACLAKPFSPEQLSAAVRKVLDGGSEIGAAPPGELHYVPEGATPAADILVVDDNERLSKLLHELLSEAGYSVATASSAAAALQAIRTSNFDLVITDLNMPGENGFDMVRALRRDFPEIRIIVTSGLMDQWSLRHAAANGADAALDKSTIPELLVGMVRRLLVKAVSRTA